MGRPMLCTVRSVWFQETQINLAIAIGRQICIYKHNLGVFLYTTNNLWELQ